MAVLNIDKWYYKFSPSQLGLETYSTTLTFNGAFTSTVNATFTRIGKLIVLTVDPVNGTPVGNLSLTASLPNQYALSPTVTGGQYSQLAPLFCFSIQPSPEVPAVLGTFPGYFNITGNILTIYCLPAMGQFVAGSEGQGTLNSQTVVYLGA